MHVEFYSEDVKDRQCNAFLLSLSNSPQLSRDVPANRLFLCNKTAVLVAALARTPCLGHGGIDMEIILKWNIICKLLKIIFVRNYSLIGK